jgi:hypothetical protein
MFGTALFLLLMRICFIAATGDRYDRPDRLLRLEALPG